MVDTGKSAAETPQQKHVRESPGKDTRKKELKGT